MMYVPDRKASKKSFSHTEIGSFVEAHPLSMYDLTTLMHMSQAPSLVYGIIH
jgi:hypothetical protein